MRYIKRLVREMVYINLALLSITFLVMSCDLKPREAFKENKNPIVPVKGEDEAFTEDTTNRDIVVFQLSKEESIKEKTYFKGIETFDSAKGKEIESTIIKESGSLDSYYGIILYKSGKEMENISLILVNSNGKVMIGYFRDNEWINVREYRKSENFMIGLNQENRIRVSIQDEKVKIYINSKKEEEVTREEINIKESDSWGISAVCNASGIIERIKFKVEKV